MNACVPLLAALLIFVASTPGMIWADGEDGPPNGQGTWHNTTASGTQQSATVSTSAGAVKVNVAIHGENPGSQGVAARSGNVIVEQPRGGSNSSSSSGGAARGGSASRSSGGSSTPSNITSLPVSDGGLNVIVNNLPTSSEATTSGNSNSTFGGTAIGGWTFDQPISVASGGSTAPPSVTTAWAAVGAVPHIDPWQVARQAEGEFPLPSIELKVNPDPGRVNVASWFWVDGYNGGELSHSKTQHASHTECRLFLGNTQCHSVDDSVTVVVRLHPQTYDWTFGDDRDNGASFDSKAGLGHGYTDANTPSPVAHTYHWSSVDRAAAGGYPITLTIAWSAEFNANGGAFQAMAGLRHTYDGRHQVRQVQALVSE